MASNGHAQDAVTREALRDALQRLQPMADSHIIDETIVDAYCRFAATYGDIRKICAALGALTEGQPSSLGHTDLRAAILETAAGIADAIDSGRGNEKYIAKAIRDYAKSGYWVRDIATLQAPALPSTMLRSPSSDQGDAA